MIRSYDQYKEMAEKSRAVAEEIAQYRKGELRKTLLERFNCMNHSNTIHFSCFELSAKEIHQVVMAFLKDAQQAGYPFNAYNLDTTKCTRLYEKPGGLESYENCLSVQFFTMVKSSEPDADFTL
jgi:hypothetical protein